MRIKIGKWSIMPMILTALLFFSIYYPPIIRINTIHVLAAISYIYIFTHSTAHRLFRIVVNKSISLYVLLIYLFLVCLVNNHIDGITGLFVVALEVMPIGCMISNLMEGCKKHSVIQFDDLIIIVATIQAIIAIAAFFIPSFQSRIIQWYIAYGFRDVFIRMSRHRLFGFSYTMAFSMPIVQGVVAAYCLYKGINKRKLYFIPLLLILFSSIINARIGIVVFAIGAVAVLGASLKPKRLISVIASLLVLYLIPTIFMRYLTNDATRTWIESGINSIVAFFNKTSYASDSYFLYVTNAEKYTLPSSFLGVIFGEGHIARGEGMYATDIGYINDIWLGGLIYCITILVFYIKNTVKMVLFYEKKIQNRVWIILGAVGILLAANIKGRVFAWNEVIMLWSLIYVNYLNESILQKDIYAR